tara:strand:+ start:882 stop:1280 length:399 start_codon:yes stop_codon:yes gene_type:complete
MKILIILLALVFLAACNTPGPHFRDVPPTRVMVEGSVFDVRVKGDLAEAVRVNPEYAPRFGPIRQRAAFAMAQISGCKVLDVLGDQALATGRLSCKGKGTAPYLAKNCVPLPDVGVAARGLPKVGAICTSSP